MAEKNMMIIEKEQERKGLSHICSNASEVPMTFRSLFSSGELKVISLRQDLGQDFLFKAWQILLRAFDNPDFFRAISFFRFSVFCE